MKTTVTLEGKTHEVGELGIAGAVAFERHFGIPASVLEPDDPTPNRMEWTAFVIFKCLQKSNVIAKTATFDEALELLDGAEIEQTKEAGDEGYEDADDEKDGETPDPTDA